MIRMPAVAGQFYPSSPEELRGMITAMMPKPSQPGRHAKLVISPHAGYIYSGTVAGITISRVTVPENVVIIGPRHHGGSADIAMMTDGHWRMPFGDIPINSELAGGILAGSSIFREDPGAHQPEHSLEVQLPFLQHLQPGLKITPMITGPLSLESCRLCAGIMAREIKELGEEVLILASTDLSHYESRARASAKDRLAIEQILQMNPAGLHQRVTEERISMCGVVPTTIALLSAIKLGATRAELVRYTDSGEVSGDLKQVVGYAGLIIN